MKLKISGPLDNLRFYCSGQIIRAFMVHKWILLLLEAGIEIIFLNEINSKLICNQL